MLGFSDKKIRALVKLKDFPSVKVGNSYLIEEDALRSWFTNKKEIKLDYSKV